jgi:hypothetical protein
LEACDGRGASAGPWSGGSSSSTSTSASASASLVSAFLPFLPFLPFLAFLSLLTLSEPVPESVLEPVLSSSSSGLPLPFALTPFHFSQPRTIPSLRPSVTTSTGPGGGGWPGGGWPGGGWSPSCGWGGGGGGGPSWYSRITPLTRQRLMTLWWGSWPTPRIMACTCSSQPMVSTFECPGRQRRPSRSRAAFRSDMNRKRQPTTKHSASLQEPVWATISAYFLAEYTSLSGTATPRPMQIMIEPGAGEVLTSSASYRELPKTPSMASALRPRELRSRVRAMRRDSWTCFSRSASMSATWSASLTMCWTLRANSDLRR